jgi:hypothetical protein
VACDVLGAPKSFELDLMLWHTTCRIHWTFVCGDGTVGCLCLVSVSVLDLESPSVSGLLLSLHYCLLGAASDVNCGLNQS